MHCAHENRSIKRIQSKEHKKILNKNGQRIRNLSDKIKHINVCVMIVPKEEKKEKKRKKDRDTI